jgi:Carboxypeptidase regulatory-like domain
MRLAAGGACLALLLQTLTASPFQQQPAAKGSIEGVVTRAGTGDPIPGARVTLTRIGAGFPQGAPPPPSARVAIESVLSPTASGISAVTDSQGRFTFKDLDSGAYRVSAGANGYSKQEFGQRTSGAQGTPINLNSGQIVSIGVSLLPAGSVSGRIRDNRGQPAVGIQVQVLKPTYNGNGQRSFQSAGSSRTDDRGEYRLFWVTPGRYFVMASSGANPSGGALISSPNEMAGDGIAPTFYPGSLDISQAATIDVKPGADIGGVDVIVNRQPSYRIRGRVIDSRNGQAPTVANVSLNTPLLTGGTSISPSVVSYDGRDGTFELRDVSPGPHTIRVTLPNSSNTVTPANAGTISAAAQAVYGQIALNVMGDMDAIVVTLSAGVSIPGRLSTEGPDSAGTPGTGSLASYRVQLRPAAGAIFSIGGSPPQSQSTSADGVFRIDNVVSGEYFVSISPLPLNVYVKQARFNQNDVLSKPMQFSSSDSGTLEVLLSSYGAQVDGTVMDERQRGVPNTQAVLIPDRLRDRIDLYKTATTDSSGHFAFRGIAPGEYHLFAWEAIDPYAYFDPDVMKQFESNGKPMHIVESAKENVDVRVIPAE